MTSSTSLGLRLIDSRTPLTANYPSSEAWNADNLPLKLPMAVLLTPTMYADLPIVFEVEKRYFMLMNNINASKSILLLFEVI